MIKSIGNLAIQQFRLLANLVFHSVYDCVGGLLGSKIPKRVKRRVEIWVTGEQRTSMSWSLGVELEQLLSVIRMAAVNHEARYYMLRKARYPESSAEGIRCLEVELVRSIA